MKTRFTLGVVILAALGAAVLMGCPERVPEPEDIVVPVPEPDPVPTPPPDIEEPVEPVEPIEPVEPDEVEDVEAEPAPLP